MSRPALSLLAPAIAFLLALPPARAVHAAWPAGGVVVGGGALGASAPAFAWHALPDGAGGIALLSDEAYPTWCFRGVDSAGVVSDPGPCVAPGWPVPDGAGGTLVIGAQGGVAQVRHFLADRSPDPAWNPNGVTLGAIAGDALPCGIADGAGGLFAVWPDPQGLSARRVPAQGTPLVPADSAARVAFSAVHADYRTPVHLAGDGSGGLLVLWRANPAPGAGQLRLQRLGAALAPAWGTDGRAVSPAGNVQEHARLMPDGAGGAWIAWEQPALNPVDTEVRVARIGAGGGEPPGWPQGGFRIGARPGTQRLPALAADGTGGAYVAWLQSGVGEHPVWLLRLAADGSVAPGWPGGGLPVTAARTLEESDGLALLADGAGGVFVAFEGAQQDPGGALRARGVRVQRIAAGGAPVAGWDPAGQVVRAGDAITGRAEILALVPDGAAGALVLWPETSDWDAPPDTFATWRAMRLGPSGPLAVPPWLIARTVDAGSVSLEWSLGGASAESVSVLRFDGGGWTLRARLLPDGAGRIAFAEAGLATATRFVYRLGIGPLGGEKLHAEAVVVTPAVAGVPDAGLPRLSLGPPVPNPARGGFRIEVALPDARTARLELLDAAGRRVHARMLRPGPGRWSVALPIAGIPAGLYLVRLTHGGRGVVRRIAIVP